MNISENLIPNFLFTYKYHHFFVKNEFFSMFLYFKRFIVKKIALKAKRNHLLLKTLLVFIILT